jgi:DNA-directed RNA polymerase subunit RPC12/RpoP
MDSTQPRHGNGTFSETTHDEVELDEDLVGDDEGDSDTYACSDCGTEVSDSDGDSYDGRCPSCADKADLQSRMEDALDIYLEEAQEVTGDSWRDDPVLEAFADGGDPTVEVLAALNDRIDTQQAAYVEAKKTSDYLLRDHLQDDLVKLRAVARFVRDDLGLPDD